MTFQAQDYAFDGRLFQNMGVLMRSFAGHKFTRLESPHSEKLQNVTFYNIIQAL